MADVDALLAGLSARQLAQWQAFYTLEPWGEEVEWLRAAIMTCAVINPHLAKGSKMKPTDLIPEFGPPAARARPSPLALRAKLMAWGQAMSAIDAGNQRARTPQSPPRIGNGWK